MQDVGFELTGSFNAVDTLRQSQYNKAGLNSGLKGKPQGRGAHTMREDTAKN